MDFNFIRSKKKPKFHGRPKPRSHDDVTLEYNRQAIQAGHKVREIQELRESIQQLEAEILDHVKLMRAARFEAKSIRPAPPEAPPADAEGGAQ